MNGVFVQHEQMFALAPAGAAPRYFFATTIVLIVAGTLSTTSTTTM
jgi:hypothetical protein